jgi:hypothetical protein
MSDKRLLCACSSLGHGMVARAMGLGSTPKLLSGEACWNCCTQLLVEPIRASCAPSSL